jgi:predicted DCC family thiol-disulfide oxidoreductase YuxK
MTPTPILYDPDCSFCRVCVAVLLRWDRHGRLRPVSLKSTEAEALLENMPEDERMASWHLVEPGAAGAVHSAGAAFAPVFGLLPCGRPLARLSARFPRASERAYRLVALRRSLLGRALPGATSRWADGVISGSRPDGR